MFGVALVLFAAAPIGCADNKEITKLPDKEGFAGSFAGTSHGALVVAGGANFPDKKPWEGGSKVWTDAVFVLQKPDGEWSRAGKLPRPLGYGVSVTYRDKVICVGGSDSSKHFADCFALEWKDGKLLTTMLPSLPAPVANACGALVGDTLFVVGGSDSPSATNALRTVCALDLSEREPKWRAAPPIPDAGRILAVAAAFDGKLWVAGGAELVTGKDGKTVRRYLKDVAFYEPTKGWKRAPALPHPAVGAPSPAPSDERGFYVLGGDDGSQLAAAPDAHKGFSKQVLRYDAPSGKWLAAGELTDPRVTAPCVRWNGAWVIPSGEVRPGGRSPEVRRFTPNK